MIDEGSWRIEPVDTAAARRLAGDLGISETLAQILVRRGFVEPVATEAFLHPDHLLDSPYLLPGVDAARRRIDRALQRDEPIAVHGDYDADGITATFLLVEVLRELGADVRWRLPNRFTEGYGLLPATVEGLAAEGVRLLLTVDCGIGARDEVELARGLGMDVVVTDHHEIEGELPDCVVVSPKLAGAPFQQLAGVGVAFKVAHALLQPRGNDRVEVPLALRPFTDVVAIGTVADLVPLVGENRSLVAMGLGRLRSAPRPGLAALLEVSGATAGDVTAGVIAFRLAPRLNAAGRLEDASLALELLGCADRETALPLALRLNELNRERQEIEQAIFADAAAQVRDPVPPALVLSSSDWHEGVVGIVASRIVERFNRPTILLSESDGVAKGSGRSIPGFDLLAGVHACAGHLTAYGGHRAACGLRLEAARVSAFREAFVGYAAETLDEDDLIRRRRVDAIVCGDELTLGLADELDQLAPHGFGNPRVQLLLHNAQIATPRLTRDRRHLQYRVKCDGASCAAVHFNFDGIDQVSGPGRFDAVLTLGANTYNGTTSAQVEVKALHRLGDASGDLCATGCDVSCRERMTGQDLWDMLLDDEWPEDGADEAAAAAEQARRDGRLLDRRGRPAVSTITSLAATGERVLVVVADVARRRPLLSRDALPQALGRRGLYVQAACARRVAAAVAEPVLVGAGPDPGPGDGAGPDPGPGDGAGPEPVTGDGAPPPDVVMAGLDLVARRPELAAAFTHVVFLDPPFSAGLHDAVVAAASDAWVHSVWSATDVHFTEKVLAAGYDLDATLRHVWRALSAGGGRFDDRLEQELLAQGPFLTPVVTIAAALQTLRAAGLLRVHGDTYELKRPQHKADMTTIETYRAWRRRFQTRAYLTACLTRPR